MTASHAPHHYLPHLARIAAVVPESEDTRTFVLALTSPVAALDAAQPGQFVMLSVFGHGEAPFTLSSVAHAGAAPGTAAVTVRRVGELTGALFDLPRGALVGVRGPFGCGFRSDPPRRTLYVAGGCGLAPLKAAIDVHIAQRPAATPIAVLYGAREPDARIHRDALAAWQRAPNVHVIECVERGGHDWTGRLGVVVEYVREAVALVRAERAAVCGPPAMLPLVAARLCRAGLDPASVDVAVERYMKCGTGHCGHCYVNQRQVCTDGPVFSFAELLQLSDAFPDLGHAISIAAG